MTTHAQEVCEQFESNAPARSHNVRQLEYTTDLLVQLAALQDEVTRLRDEKRLAEIDYQLHTDALLRETATQAEVTHLRDALAVANETIGSLHTQLAIARQVPA